MSRKPFSVVAVSFQALSGFKYNSSSIEYTPVHTEHCQWTMLCRDISTVMSMCYRYVGGSPLALPAFLMHVYMGTINVNLISLISLLQCFERVSGKPGGTITLIG